MYIFVKDGQGYQLVELEGWVSLFGDYTGYRMARKPWAGVSVQLEIQKRTKL
jgi:hypothetical protein